MANKKIGQVTHFYSEINVGIIKLTDKLKVGDRIQFKGYTTDFEQDLDSMQYDHENIEEAKKGEEVGVKVNEKVREGDEVFLAE
jgi:putative protease